MIRHIVVMRFAPDTAEQRQRLLTGLGELARAIPEIRAYSFGPDTGLGDGNWDLGIVADFDDMDGYRAYARHPAHLVLIEDLVRPILAERAAVQVEVTP